MKLVKEIVLVDNRFEYTGESKYEMTQPSRSNKHNITKDELIRLYIDEGYSQEMLRRHFKSSRRTITYYLNKYNIKHRLKNDAIKLAAEKGRYYIAKTVNNPNWKGGEIKRHGYIYVLHPNHHRTTKQGYVLRSILNWEKANNTLLPNGWVVHHKGTKYPQFSIENKQDDRPENLEAMPRNKHPTYIHYLEDRVKELEGVLDDKNEKG